MNQKLALLFVIALTATTINTASTLSTLFNLYEGPVLITPNLLKRKIEKTARNERTLSVLFYSPKCPHCVAFLPTYTKVGLALYENMLNIETMKVDCMLSPSASQEYDIKFFPTLIVFKEGKELTRLPSNRSRSFDSIFEFLQDQITVTSPAASLLKKKSGDGGPGFHKAEKAEKIN